MSAASAFIRGVGAAIALLLVGSALAPALAQDDPGQIDATKLSKVPKQKKFVEAEYPPEAFAQGIEAEVILLLDIDEKGFVTGVGIQTPATPAGMGFDEAAMIVASQWEFEPAELDGKPIAVQISYRYRFTIKPKTPPAGAGADAGPEGGDAGPTAGADAGIVDTGPSAPAGKPVVNFAGKLLERGTRVPMAGVIVTVFRDDVQPPVGFEAATDETGAFVFFDLAPADWKVLVDAPGYYPYRTSETIVAGERTDVTYFVEKASYNPYDVTVTASRPKKEVSRTVLKAEEIEKVPGGAGDPLTVVQNFAGVARPDNPALLVVRGSAPEDTKVLVDGIQVPFIYHFGGLRSILPIGVLESIEFYPGNFSPMYGRATGGIIDVRIKDLKPKKLGGYADISILDTSVYLEIPIPDGGIAIAGRRSYIDVLINAAVPEDAGIAFATAPRYYDFHLLGSWRPEPAHDLRFFGFFSDDRLALLFANPADLDPTLEGAALDSVTTFYRGTLQYRYVPSTTFENTLRLSFGNDDTETTIGQLGFELHLTSAQLLERAAWKLSDKFTLVLGADIGAGSASGLVRLPLPPKEGTPMTDFDIGEILVSEIEPEFIIGPALYGEVEITPIDGLLLLPGVRVDYFETTSEVVAQPRFTGRWQLDPQWVVKGGVGLFTQEPTPDETDDVFGNPALGPEKALHVSAGAEYKPLEHVTLDATVFYKDMWDLVSPTDTTTMVDGNERPLIYDNGGTGRVYGLELQARHELSDGLTGWLAYTLSRAERTDSGSSESRLFDFDQTHILTLVLGYTLPRNWLLGARLRVVSGNPATPVIGSTYDAVRDEYQAVFGPTNSSRDGTFHQLDLRLDKRWIYQKWILSTYLDIQNVYDQDNPEGTEYNFDFSQSRPQTGVPIVTIIGIRGEF